MGLAALCPSCIFRRQRPAPEGGGALHEHALTSHRGRGAAHSHQVPAAGNEFAPRLPPAGFPRYPAAPRHRLRFMPARACSAHRARTGTSAQAPCSAGFDGPEEGPRRPLLASALSHKLRGAICRNRAQNLRGALLVVTMLVVFRSRDKTSRRPSACAGPTLPMRSISSTVRAARL